MAYNKTVWQDTPSTATPINADNLNKIEDGIEAHDTAIDNIENKIEFKGCLVARTTTQSISDNTNTVASFNSEVYDEGNFYSSGQPTRLTIPAGVSKVKLSGNVIFASHSTGWRRITISKNGGGFIGSFDIRMNAVNGTDTGLQGSTPVIDVVEGDYFELGVHHTRGSALNTVANTLWFSIEAID